MTRPRSPEFGEHVRKLVGVTRAKSGKSIASIEAELAEKIGISPRTFQNHYQGRGHIDARVIRVLFESASEHKDLGRAWGERLIQLAGFGHDETALALLEQTWPSAQIPAPAAPPCRSNLPPPTYARFVMRAVAFADLLEALGGRTPVVTIEGMGGLGKTSLAREFAGRSLSPSQEDRDLGLPSFDVVIWASDKDHPGYLRLSNLLPLIATLLGHPEATRHPDRLKSDVDQLLRARRVLLVIDNLETVADPLLIPWLLTVPEPSKVLATTRVVHPELKTRGAWQIELKRMSEREGRDFIALHSRRIKLPVPDEATQRQLITDLGGNAKAMEIVLGLAKRTGRPLMHVLQTSGSEVADLVASSWVHVSPIEQQVAQALCLFPDSVEDSVLARVAGVASATFIDAVAHLSDLALIETEQCVDGTAAPTRRALHPLTRQFVADTLEADSVFAAAARARRLAWAVEYAGMYGGHRPNQPDALARLDTEEPALWDIFTWASDLSHHREALTMARSLEFYYYSRANWGRNQDLYARAIRAARGVNDPAELSDTLALFIQMLSRQGRPQQAQDELAELIRLSRRMHLRGEQFFRAQHAQGLALMALGQLEAAALAWTTILDQAEERGVSARLRTGVLHWLALCRWRQGEPHAARTLMEQSLAMAVEQHNSRRAARNQIALASFALDEDLLDEAAQRLNAALALMVQPDEEQRAHFLLARGRLQAASGDRLSARASLEQAHMLFERMGMEAEAVEARGRLAGLD